MSKATSKTQDLNWYREVSETQWGLVGNLVSQNINVLLSGYYGVGKTHGAMKLAESIGKTPIRIALSGDSLSQEMTGFFIISSSGSQFQKGYMTHPYSNALLIIDEIDKTNPSIQTSLLPLMDGKPIRLLNGETFQMSTPSIFTANNVQMIEPALLDRLWQVEIKTPHPSFFDCYPEQISIGCLRIIKDNQSPRNLLRLYSIYQSETGSQSYNPLHQEAWIRLNKQYGLPFEMLATVDAKEAI